MLKFLGIDPGSTGAIAVLNEEGNILDIFKMPSDDDDLFYLLKDLSRTVTLAALERQQAFPEQMKTKDGKIRVQNRLGAQKFLEGYGYARGLLMGLGIPFEKVSPITWQRYMHCLTGGWKLVSTARAQELFPRMKVAQWNADALLLAEYIRLKTLGRLPVPVKIKRWAGPQKKLIDIF